jgi:hypothetical protein
MRKRNVNGSKWMRTSPHGERGSGTASIERRHCEVKMVKLTDDMARALAVILLCQDEDRGYGFWDTLTELVRERGWMAPDGTVAEGTPERGQIAVQIVVNHPPRDMYNTSTLLSTINDQLISGAAPDDDEMDPDESAKLQGDLIDTIAEMLQSPYAQNVLSGSTLGVLRKALLRPEEASKLREETRKVLRCTCGINFISGEAVTFGDDETPQFRCRRCHRPSYARCRTRGCDRVVIMDRTGRAGDFCEAHTAAEPQVAEPQVGRNMPLGTDFLNTLRRGIR